MTPEELAKQVLEGVHDALEGGELDAQQVYAISRILRAASERAQARSGAGELISRDLESVDSDLRLVVDIRRTCREHNWPMPSSARANDLLDERRALFLRNPPL